MTAPAPGSARPPGNVPKNSIYGMVALGMLPGLIPFLVLQSLVPVLRNGLDVWLSSIWPVLGLSAVASTIMAAGMFRRRTWYIRFVFAFGALLLAAFVASFCLGLAILLGLVRRQAPDLSFMNVVNIIDWLVISPLAWLLLRTLRLRYWQPWTTPDQWEPPAAVPPTGTLLMTWAQRKR